MNRRSTLAAVAAVALVLAGATAGWALRGGEPKPVKRVALAQSDHPRGAEDRDLGLAKVTIPAGAAIPLHHHLGTQIAHIARGALTYTVRDGGVRIRDGQPGIDSEVVGRIAAGETGKVRAGQWIVEQPQTIHQAKNRGNSPVVIFVATLLREGAPPSTPVTP